MKLKILLNLMLFYSFSSFAMESECKEQKEEKSEFSLLPNEVILDILFRNIQINPKLSILENFKSQLPAEINKIYEVYGYKVSMADKYLKNSIYKKIGKLIKNSYSQDKINSAFIENAKSKSPKSGDIAQILFYSGMKDMNTRDSNEAPVLNIAAREDNFPLVKFLVEHGAKVNVKNKYGQSPLSAASLYGSFETVNYLVNHGAIVNFTQDTLHNAILSTKRQFRKSKNSSRQWRKFKLSRFFKWYSNSISRTEKQNRYCKID